MNPLAPLSTSGRALLLALLASAIQDGPPDFLKLLEAAERVGFSVPELPDAVAKLDARAAEPGAAGRIAAEHLHRHQILRAQAAVVGALHARLTRQKGSRIDMPIPPDKSVSVKILEVQRNGVEVGRSVGSQVVPFAELDPEWALQQAREGFASPPDASLLAGLWLAKAARWEAAFRELADSPSSHPLVVETRRRGLNAILKQTDTLIAAKRWKEALARIKSAEKLAPDDPPVAAARTRLLNTAAEAAKEHSLKGNKKAMEDLIDFIVANFSGAEGLAGEIREESRWITLADPKAFGLAGKEGAPILLDPGDLKVATAYVKDVAGTFDGVSVRIRFAKAAKEAHGGPLWMGRNCKLQPWIVRDDSMLLLGRLTENSGKWDILADSDVPRAETYEIRALLEKGDVVVSVNGREVVRHAGGETEIASPGVQASHGRLTFDRFRLRKKP